MFDDQQQPAGGAVPPNLPVGEPEDIFASVDTSAPPVSDLNGVPSTADLASDQAPSASTAPSALSAGVLRPRTEQAPPEEMSPAENLYAQQTPQANSFPAQSDSSLADMSAPPQPAQPMVSPSMSTQAAPASMPEQTRTLPTDVPEMYAVKEPRTSKGIMTIVIILVVLCILGIAGYFLYTNVIAKPSLPEGVANDVLDTTGQTSAEVIEPISGNDTTIPPIDTTEQEQNTDSQSDILFGVPVDTDADGLEDQREVGLGTDPAHWDSDGDELSDGDEVIIWKTDPLNPDTDGDGYTDGSEIKNGYNPTGPGKIFEPPVTENTTSTP